MLRETMDEKSRSAVVPHTASVTMADGSGSAASSELQTQTPHHSIEDLIWLTKRLRLMWLETYDQLLFRSQQIQISRTVCYSTTTDEPTPNARTQANNNETNEETGSATTRTSVNGMENNPPPDCGNSFKKRKASHQQTLL